MAGELAVAVAVIAGQEGDRVLVSVPVAGFPAGFRLRAGERVALATDAADLVARPLVRTRVVGLGEAAAADLAVQEATARSEVPASDRAPVGSQVVFETDSGGGPGQTVAIRTPR
jgi:hypothetical protein